MSLADILESEIQGEISAIQQQANTRAAEIVAQAQEQAQSLIDSRTRLLANEKAAGLTRAKSAADLDSNAQRLSASDSLQTRAFQEAESQLQSHSAASRVSADRDSAASGGARRAAHGGSHRDQQQ